MHNKLKRAAPYGTEWTWTD